MFRHRDSLSRPVRHSLRSSVIDGSAYSVMVGLGETYLPAFVLAIGLGEVIAGLVTTVPMLMGAVLQLISPRVIRHTGSHRRWVVLCAAVQGVAFIPLAIAAWKGHMPAWSVLAVATVYWGTAMAAGPAWNTWMGHLVPMRLRTRFFTNRTRFAQGFVMVGLVIGGVTLHITKLKSEPLLGFVFVFAIACLSRLISSWYLMRQSEPYCEDFVERTVTAREMAGRFQGSAGALMLYMAGVQVTAQLAAPYFTPFMLQKLEFSYLLYVGMLATSFFSKSMSMIILGRVAEKWGANTLLWIGGLGIVPLAVMWVVSGSPWYLLPTQVLAGACWGAYELATFLLLFETIPNHERTSVLTTFNLVNSAAIVTGSVVGGLILRSFDKSVSAYWMIFALSTVGRALSLLLLRRVQIDRSAPVPMLIRNLTVRASGGSVDRPILTSIDDETRSYSRRDLFADSATSLEAGENAN